jgi:hypothetical protein
VTGQRGQSLALDVPVIKFTRLSAVKCPAACATAIGVGGLLGGLDVANAIPRGHPELDGVRS